MRRCRDRAPDLPRAAGKIIDGARICHNFLTHFADRPLPVDAINPSRLISRNASRMVSREIPGQSASTSEIENGSCLAKTTAITCPALEPLRFLTSSHCAILDTSKWHFGAFMAFYDTSKFQFDIRERYS